MLFTIFHLILFVLLTPTNYCFHDKVLLPLLEIPPILVLYLVVIFHIFCNLANCHPCNVLQLILFVLLSTTIYCFHRQAVGSIQVNFKMS